MGEIAQRVDTNARNHDDTVRERDAGDENDDEIVNLVVEVNEPRTDTLPHTDIDENAADGTLMKVAVAIYPDEGDTFALELVDDAGGRFAIDGASGAVTVADGARLDFETSASHEVTIRMTDSGGARYEETFTIHVNDENEAPTDLDLSATSVLENVNDQEEDDGITFELLNDVDRRVAVDRNLGDIGIADNGLIDFESNANHPGKISDPWPLDSTY